MDILLFHQGSSFKATLCAACLSGQSERPRAVAAITGMRCGHRMNCLQSHTHYYGRISQWNLFSYMLSQNPRASSLSCKTSLTSMSSVKMSLSLKLTERLQRAVNKTYFICCFKKDYFTWCTSFSAYKPDVSELSCCKGTECSWCNKWVVFDLQESVV